MGQMLPNHKRPTISVVIVNWNGREWLEKSLPAVAAQSYRDFEVIVVDNGSQDGSADWLGESWPDVRLLALSTNTGFSRANNLGIGIAEGEWIATLNNDTLADPDWLQNLIQVGEEADVGMAASLIVYWNRPEIVDAAGLTVDRAGIAWNRGHGMPANKFSHECEVFGAPASAALYRRLMLDEIGLFDESFFAYYEDVDLAWRAQRAGWKCRYCPQARVLHWHSATSKRLPELKIFLQSRNKIWTIAKNYSWPELFFRLPLIFFFDFLSMSYRLLSDRNLAGLKGRFAAMWRLREMWSTRLPGGPVPLLPVQVPWRFSRDAGA